MSMFHIWVKYFYNDLLKNLYVDIMNLLENLCVNKELFYGKKCKKIDK